MITKPKSLTNIQCKLFVGQRKRDSHFAISEQKTPTRIMLMRCAFLLVVVVLLTISDGASSALVLSQQGFMAKMAARDNLSPRLMKATKDVAISGRSLRSLAGTDVNDHAKVVNDDRGMNPSPLTKLGQFASKLRAGNMANKLWLKAEVHPESAFKLLGLDKPGVNFFGNPKVLQWLKFTKAYMDMKPKSGFGELSTYALLYEKTSAADLSLLLRSLKDAPGAEWLVRELRRYQFIEWNGKKIKPEQLAKSVFKIEDLGQLSKSDQRRNVIDDYAKYLKDEEEFQKKIVHI